MNENSDAGLSGIGKVLLVISCFNCCFGIGFWYKRRKAKREKALMNEILLSVNDKYDNKDKDN